MKMCNPSELKKKIDTNSACQIIDVREYPEFVSEKISGSTWIPLSALKKDVNKINRDVPIYLLCAHGVRASMAARQLEKKGFSNLNVIEGGMASWLKAGFPVERGELSVWSIERQVRFAAGSLVLIGSLLGWFFHPAWFALPVFIAAGLMFSAITNTCGMAMVLFMLPWNREPKSIRSE